MKKSVIIWIVMGIIILGLGVFFLLNSEAEKTINEQGQEQTNNEGIVCEDYDGNEEACLSYQECEWMSGDQLCNILGGDNKVDNQDNENWKSEIVDDDGWVGIDSSIAVDSNGNPYICHYDQAKRDLKYAYFDGNSWNLETIDSQGDVGEECGIAVDENNSPHISYIDVTNGGIKYAVKKWNLWNVETIDKKSGTHVVSTSIVVDADDKPHIAYNMESNNGDQVKYASWDGNFWKMETVSSEGGMDVYLALDSNNYPHISFIKDIPSNKARIYHARKISGKWKVEMVDSSAISGGDTGIVVDSNNYIHITYHDYGNGAIKYAKWDSVSWDIQTVAMDIGSEEGLKITVDAMNNPHIIYSDSKKELLMYAVLKGGVWNKEVVSKMGNPSITVDYLGRVHVSHGYSPDNDENKEREILKYSIRE